MKKKIYISLPIAFHEDTVYQRNQEAKDYLFNKFSNQYEWVSPIDNNHINEEDLANHLQIGKTAYYMGRDIEQVILALSLRYGKSKLSELYPTRISTLFSLIILTNSSIISFSDPS